jgi:hypothetical protein
MRTAVTIALILGLLLLPGCGGPMKSSELKNSVGTLQSAAAEGELLAGDVARDRTRATFARGLARDLSDIADHEAEKLADATPRESIADDQAEAIRLAEDIAQALGKIQVEPGSEAAGREAENELSRLADRAMALGDSL